MIILNNSRQRRRGYRNYTTISCLGCAEPGKYLTLGIAKILPTTKSSKKIQF